MAGNRAGCAIVATPDTFEPRNQPHALAKPRTSQARGPWLPSRYPPMPPPSSPPPSFWPPTGSLMFSCKVARLSMFRVIDDLGHDEKYRQQKYTLPPTLAHHIHRSMCSVAFNSMTPASLEDMLCYSGNGKLYVRTGSFPVQEQARRTATTPGGILMPCTRRYAFQRPSFPLPSTNAHRMLRRHT